jgi:membrane protein DedA with SNARE-associated domain
MPWLRFMLTSIIGAFFGRRYLGFTAYSLGQQVARLAGWMALVFGLSILIVIVVAAVFVKRHEAQLTAEAVQALPGPPELP